MTDAQTVNLALGRIFRMASRPEQPGDAAEYWRCRSLIMNELDDGSYIDCRPDYGRDRLRGAQGDQ